LSAATLIAVVWAAYQIRKAARRPDEAVRHLARVQMGLAMDSAVHLGRARTVEVAIAQARHVVEPLALDVLAAELGQRGLDEYLAELYGRTAPGRPKK
jgi:hypothetical protein